jgi:hypothetical protein
MTKKKGKKIASIYLASDSRYTWNNTRTFDSGPKLFGAINFPEIFGFCGDVLFPLIVLKQIVTQIDNRLLIDDADNAKSKNMKIFNYINSSFKKYPKEACANGAFTILHATRVETDFYLFKISLEKNGQLKNEEIILPAISKVVYSGGSGKEEFDNNWLFKWDSEKHNNFRTSRGAYHCLSQTLKTIKDAHTGGLPQIVGLYRNKNSRLFGIIENKKKYIFGKESPESINSSNIEWRNEKFERMNPETLKIIEGAQRQPL